MSETAATAPELIQVACPMCGAVGPRRPYDIGGGPELECKNCGWCWGVNGQELSWLMGDPPEVYRCLLDGVDDARRMRAANLADHIRRVVAAVGPPLTPTQGERLHLYLGGW